MSEAAQSGAVAGATASEDATRAWRAMRDSADIQFDPLMPVKPPQPPDWLTALGEWLRWLLEPLGRAIGLSWPVLQWVLIGLAALCAAWLAWVLLRPLLDRKRAAQADTAEWVPDEAQAMALLEDADRLAAEGRFGEAAHLLLRRSVHHIAEARPDWLHPATTAREIARAPSLPERARRAFGEIAGHVERSRFALRELGLEDWQAARRAYAEFALQPMPA